MQTLKSLSNKKNRALLATVSSMLMMSLLATACGQGFSTSAGVNRPKTTAAAGDGLNPQFQTASIIDASSASTDSSDFSIGTGSTSGQYVLNFTIVDTGRAMNFQTVQTSKTLGSATQTYNGRYIYNLDARCIDDACNQVIFMVSETDNTNGKSYQSVFVIYSTGNGYQIAASKLGTSYDFLDEAMPDMIYGPTQN